MNTKSFSCHFYPTASTTLARLVARPAPFHAIDDCEEPIAGALIFDPNAPARFGSFKKALLGHTSSLVLGSRKNICIKQCWYRGQTTGSRLIYDSATQVMKLSQELNCIRWASGLMHLVYDFIDKHIQSEPAPFKIPKMRFVFTALVVIDNETHDTYMIEEMIDDASEGDFVKYIGNNSAKPVCFLDQGMVTRAEFLAFCQHVQYVKTKQLAFIGDFQGK